MANIEPEGTPAARDHAATWTPRRARRPARHKKAITIRAQVEGSGTAPLPPPKVKSATAVPGVFVPGQVTVSVSPETRNETPPFGKETLTNSMPSKKPAVDAVNTCAQFLALPNVLSANESLVDVNAAVSRLALSSKRKAPGTGMVAGS
jgi:hypothetical protein